MQRAETSPYPSFVLSRAVVERLGIGIEPLLVARPAPATPGVAGQSQRPKDECLE